MLVYNLNYDPLRSPTLHRTARPARVEMLDTNGSWVTPQWTWENGALHITEPLPCHGERLFRIR